MKQLFIPPQLEFILRKKVKPVIIKFKNSKLINRKTLKELLICPSCISSQLHRFHEEIRNLDESLSFGGTKCSHISGSIFFDTHSYNIFVNEVNGKNIFPFLPHNVL